MAWRRIYGIDQAVRIRLTNHSSILGIGVFLTGILCAAGDEVRVVRLPEGGLQPVAVTGADFTGHLVYLKGNPRACDVIYLRRETGKTNASHTWKANSQPGNAMAIGSVRGAQLALGMNERVHVVWNGSSQVQDGSPMFYTRMNGKGNGFEPERNLMTSTRHLDGGGSVAADRKGNVYVVWHGHASNGPQDESHRAVFMAKSSDNGVTFAPERRIDPGSAGVCSCCGLKAFADANGNVSVLYRSATESGGRDVVLLRSTDQGATFQSETVGPWQVATCPMSTMALGRGAEDSLLAMWERQGRVYYEWRKGAEISNHEMVADGSGQKHPTFALGSKGELLLAWTEGTAWEKGGVMAWQIIDKNNMRKAKGRAEGVPVWGGVAAVAEADGGFTVFY